MTDLYVSTDIETNGDNFLSNSMLSFASVVFDIDKKIVASFEANLELVPGTTSSPKTDLFWAANQTAYDATRVNCVSAERAFKEYVEWLKQLDGNIYFAAYPVGFDYTWMNYYMIKYAGENPFGHSNILDIKSYAMGLLKSQSLSKSTKRYFRSRWFDRLPHTHIAIDDALEQGALIINMIRDSIGERPAKISDLRTKETTCQLTPNT